MANRWYFYANGKRSLFACNTSRVVGGEAGAAGEPLKAENPVKLVDQP
jgi:hypothetical protein